MTLGNTAKCCTPIVPLKSPVLDSFDDTTVPEDGLSLQDTPPSDRTIRSTPQSPEPPKIRLLIEVPIHSPYPASSNILMPAQREELHSISTLRDLQYQTEHSPHPASSNYNTCPIYTLDNADTGRKRKAAGDERDDEDDEDDEDSGHGSHPPVKKTVHSIIENRYRTKLNNEISALRNSVPSLHVVTKSARGEDTAGDREDLLGLTAAHKLNEATVLEKATEYIHHLEKRNTRLTNEKTAMKARITAFEKLFMAGLQEPYPTSPNNSHTAPYINPQGVIDIPDDFRRLRAADQVIQETYQFPQERHEPASRAPSGLNEWQEGGGHFRNMMVASLAGLMILEGFSEAGQDGSARNAYGLFAFPTQILCGMGRYLRSSSDISVLGYHLSAGQILALLKLMLAFGTLLSFYIPSFFETGPKVKTFRTLSPPVAAAPSRPSSIQVRRQAWLTAIRTVWVPRHNFIREATALSLKMIELSIRNVIGWYGYTLLTGITEQQEAARVKAWEIALDAQLAGGDVEVSKSRLVLTLIASCTLPDTPVRLMLRALHIRVLLWDTGNSGFDGFYMFREIAAKLARSKWNEAKYLQVLLSHPHIRSSEQEYEPLPEHVAALLEQECDDVLVDSIGQRAYNLAWNLPTTHNAVGPSDGMDDVVDDNAIRSPLDAVAAWRSGLILQTALANSLASNDESVGSDIGIGKGIERDINLAIKTAPVGSRAHLRALVARAVVFDVKRGANIVRALQALAPFEPQDVDPTSIGTTLATTSTSITSLPDLKMSLDCATAVAHLERSPSSATPTSAFSTHDIRLTDLGLLGFVAAFKLMETLLDHEVACVNCSHILENLASTLRIWIGGAGGRKSGLRRETRERVVEKCIRIKKKMIGMEKDAGNETVSEEGIEEEC